MTREAAAQGWRRLKRALTWPLALLAALIILFEEYAWDELSAALGRLAAWPPLAALERRIANLPPWAALAMFALPAALLLPVKLAALFLIGRGHALLGLLIILLAKLGGTALAARLFTLTRPALMRVAWFVRLYNGFVYWRVRIFERLHASAPWRLAHALAGFFRRGAQRSSFWPRIGRRLARRWRGRR